MRQIFGRLTKELYKHTTPKTVGKDPAYRINSFRELVEQIAKLSHKNKDSLLFYRGQKNDYLNKAGVSTFYPTIYRGDYLTQQELNYRFDMLYSASKMLSQEFKNRKIEGYTELIRKKYIQWSILQHYGVTGTPLSDLTQSIRVACSFALLNNEDETAYIYVFGLPYYTNRISINSEHDLVNIRLLSITPPSALRPYFQEGYLIGTEDITNEYVSKSELDLNQRLFAKYEIPNNRDFWSGGFDKIPENALYPDNDIIKDLCDEIKLKLKPEVENGDLGHFLKLWSEIENYLIEQAKKYQRNVFNLRRALFLLMDKEPNTFSMMKEFDYLRNFRNKLVHNPASISKSELSKVTGNLEYLIKEYKKEHSRVGKGGFHP